MPVSLDSSRPILADAANTSRYSTFSMAPSVSPSLAPSVDSTVIPSEIAAVATGIKRLENPALSSQRVVLSEERVTNLQKLALGAKLERALDRRMSGQDAVMRPRAKTLPNTAVGVTEKSAA